MELRLVPLLLDSLAHQTIPEGDSAGAVLSLLAALAANETLRCAVLRGGVLARLMPLLQPPISEGGGTAGQIPEGGATAGSISEGGATVGSIPEGGTCAVPGGGGWGVSPAVLLHGCQLLGVALRHSDTEGGHRPDIEGGPDTEGDTAGGLRTNGGGRPDTEGGRLLAMALPVLFWVLGARGAAEDAALGPGLGALRYMYIYVFIYLFI